MRRNTSFIQHVILLAIAIGGLLGLNPEPVAAQDAPLVVFMIGEKEYETDRTLPKFAKEVLAPAGIESRFVFADKENKHHFAGLEVLNEADLLFVSVRRRGVPAEQMKQIRTFLESGKPIVGIRTACHAFFPREELPEGYVRWDKFDPEVLGGNYHGHHNNKLTCQVHTTAAGKTHRILSGLHPDTWTSKGSLYEVSPIHKDAVVLLAGSIPNEEPEPVAWTHSYKGGRVFFTSLGHPGDFENAEFNQFLANGVSWGLGRE